MERLTPPFSRPRPPRNPNPARQAMGAGRLERRVRLVGRETMPGLSAFTLCLCCPFGAIRGKPLLRLPYGLLWAKNQKSFSSLPLSLQATLLLNTCSEIIMSFFKKSTPCLLLPQIISGVSFQIDLCSSVISVPITISVAQIPTSGYLKFCGMALFLRIK